MKIDLTDLSPVKKRMSIEVDPKDVQRETDSVLRGYARKARIPGFRKGKAPLSVMIFARPVCSAMARLADEVNSHSGGRPDPSSGAEDTSRPSSSRARARISPTEAWGQPTTIRDTGAFGRNSA